MEEFDPTAESQVWQRVFAQPELKRDCLRPLLLSSMEAAAAYRQLAEKLTGHPKELARGLHAGEQATLAALRGIAVLSGSGGGKTKAMPAPREHTGKLLEKYYHRARRALAEYTARSVDPEFGTVFQRLAQREGEHCAMIVQLLGSLKT